MKTFALATVAGLLLAGCATITDGNRQQITLSSNAEEATCSITQRGNIIVPPQGIAEPFLVPRRRGNLIVTCAAPGHETSTVALVNGKQPGTVIGMMVIGALFNVTTDAVSHSWHEAQDTAYVHLNRI